MGTANGLGASHSASFVEARQGCAWSEEPCAVSIRDELVFKEKREIAHWGTKSQAERVHCPGRLPRLRRHSRRDPLGMLGARENRRGQSKMASCWWFSEDETVLGVKSLLWEHTWKVM